MRANLICNQLGAKMALPYGHTRVEWKHSLKAFNPQRRQLRTAAHLRKATRTSHNVCWASCAAPILCI